MKRNLTLAALSLFLSACSFISPYSITFTTPDESVVNPASDTLDLVLSAPALAYLSSFQCDEREAMDLLPIVKDEIEASNVYNLSLMAIQNEPDGSLCKITVTAFDRTTTAHASASISLYVRVKPVGETETAEDGPVEESTEEPVVLDPNTESAQAACVEQGGTWNECASACPNPEDICIQVCVAKCEFPNEEPTEPKPAEASEPSGETAPAGE